MGGTERGEGHGRTAESAGVLGEDLAAALDCAVCEAAHRLAAAAAAVYLLSAEGDELRAAMIGGGPPAVFTLPGRMPLNAPYASARALATRAPAVLDDPDPPSEANEGTVPYPYSAASVPLLAGEHRFGSLTVLRAEDYGGYTDADCELLRRIGERHAAALSGLLARGAELTPGSLPLLVPVLGTGPAALPPTGAPEIVRGVPGVAGSAGMSLLYSLQRLSAMLNQATSMEHVTGAADFCVRGPFRARAMVLASAADGRLWVLGHSGLSSHLVRELHGTPLHTHAHAARASSGRASFFSVDPHRPADADAAKDRFGTPAEEEADVLLEGAYKSAASAGVEAVREDECEAAAFLPLVGSRHVLDLPVPDAGRVAGICCLTFGGPRTFSPEERAVLTMMAGLLGSAVQRVELSSRRQALAESIQARLLPPALTEVPRLTTVARYRPAAVAGEAGGDWYDVITMPDDRVALVVGDVEGHTVESAAVMGQLRSAVAAYATEGHGPAALLQRTGALLDRLGTELLATCCVVALDTDDGSAEVALAGHPAPFLRQSDGTVRRLEAPANVPLGLTGDTPWRAQRHPLPAYQGQRHVLPADSVLMLYSNGLIDPTDPGGTGALLAAAAREAGGDLEALADRLLSGRCGPRGRRDDTALLLARYEGADSAATHRTGHLHIQRRDLRGAREARGFVHDRLCDWGLADMTDDLELITSEVVTNALVHAGSDVDVRIRFFGHRVRLEVRDADTDPPVPTPYSLSEEGSSRAEHGRGLFLVDAMADAWNTSPSGRGKTVWLEVDVPRTEDRPVTW